MTRFAMMTWNVENLFRPGTSELNIDGATYRRKIEFLAGVIRSRDVDLVALQEVGGDGPLADLQAALGADYAQRRIGVADGRGIAVGVISRLPLDDAADIATEPFPSDTDPALVAGGRGALRIALQVGDLRLHLITAHLKSKLLTFTRPDGTPAFSTNDEEERVRVGAEAVLRRTAEARTLRRRVNELLPGDAVIVTGDLNDVADAATTLFLAGPPGSEIGTGGFHQPDRGDPQRLWNLAPAIAEDRRYSRVFQGRRELIDHIFVSDRLLPRQDDGKRRLPEVDSLVDLEEHGLPSITEARPAASAHSVLPDHAPQVAVFSL